jgi:hypothetical protein
MERSGPVEISGKGVYPREGLYNVPVEYDFNCKYANGIEMRVANSSQLPLKRGGATWFGEKGWINVDRGRFIASDPKILEEVIGENEFHTYKTPTNHSGNFLDCVKSREETIAPIEVAHRSISVGLLGEIAMTTGQKIQWDPVKEEVIGNPIASRLLTRPYRQPWNLPTI